MDPSFKSASMDYNEYYDHQSDNLDYDEYYDHQSHNSFEEVYYSLKSDKESGDKILMPPSALRSLDESNVQYPMLFELRNPTNNRVSHCGVLEFTAEEDFIILPSWMMENMKLEETDTVIVKNVSLEKGTYMKLLPHSMKFVELSNPKAVLETQLRRFSCLTAGDTIMVMHNHNKYYIDVLETRPSSAITVIDTDCEVDFAPPLDYKEPEKPAKKVACNVQEKPVEEEIKFKPFIGVARRLDGTPIATECSTSNGTSTTTQPKLHKSHVIKSHKEVAKEDVKGETTKKSEQTFQAFTGRSFKLTG